MISFFKLLVFSLVYVFSFEDAWSAGQVIPPLKTEQEEAAFIALVQRQIPFATYNNSQYVANQLNGVQLLRKKFPDYDRWMSEKPNPVTIEIYRENEVAEIANHLNQDLLHKTQEQIATRTQSKDIAIKNLLALINQSGNSLRGLIVGLAQALPAEKRKEFLRLGKPQLQIEYLESQKLSDEDIRASAFRADTVGLDQATVTFKQILDVARQRLDTTQEMFVQLALLKALSKDGRNRGTLLPTDFEFVFKANDPFLQNVMEGLTALDKNVKFQSAIESFQANIPRAWFTPKKVLVKQASLMGSVVEVHPYLSVHRGCIGGDCSTTNSPLFPYSPWEHDFYIRNADGHFVAYISGARVRAGGVDSYYLRDIQGANLSPALAESVLHAFPEILNHLGVRQLVLANAPFTNSQNNSPNLKRMLSEYNQGAVSIVPVEFIDKDIRDYIGTNRDFRSNYSYDAPQFHTQGVVFKPKPNFAKNLKFKVFEGTLPVPKIREVPEAFLTLLKMRLRNPNINLREFPEVMSSALSIDLQAIDNVRGVSLAEYYRSVEDIFAKYKLEFSRSFFDSHEDLFMAGHLRASDAFFPNYQYIQERFLNGGKENKQTIFDNPIVKISERLLIQMARQHISYDAFIEVVAKHYKILKESKKFQELMRLYAERMQPYDVFQLYGLAQAGVEQAKQILEMPENQKNIEFALLYLLMRTPEELGLTLYVSKILDFINVMSAQDYPQRVLARWNQLLEPFKLSFERLQNVELIGQIIVSVHTAGAAYGFDQYSSEQILSQKIRNPEIQVSRATMLHHAAFLTFNRTSSNLVDSYLDFLNANLDHMNSFEIYSLARFGSVKAQEIMKQEPLKAKIKEIIFSYMHDENPIRTKVSALIHDFVQNPRKVGTIPWPFPLQVSGRNFKQAVEDINNKLNPFGLSFQDVVESPDLQRGLAESWVKMPGLFSAQSSAWLAFNLQMTARYLVSTQEIVSENIWNEIVANYDYLKQKPAFRNFVSAIEADAKSGRCMNCVLGIVELVNRGFISNSLPNSKEFLGSLLKTNSKSLVAYAMVNAYRSKLAFPPADDRILSLLSKVHEDAVKSHNLVLQDQILKLFSQIVGKNKNVVDQMTKVMSNSYSNRAALLAALSYIRSGGDPEAVIPTLTKTYDREELFENQDPNNTRLFKLVLTRSSMQTKFCRSLF